MLFFLRPILLFLEAMTPSIAFARGGHSGNPRLFFGLLAVLLIGGALFLATKHYRDFFQILGGLFVLSMAAVFVADILQGLGLVSGENYLVSFAATFVAALIFAVYKS